MEAEEGQIRSVLESLDVTPTKSPDGVYSMPDIAEAFITAQGREPFVTIKVAKESASLRSLWMDVEGKGDIECVMDPGCMVVAMSEAVALKLGISFDPRYKLHMESANGSTDFTLGLARNVAFTLEGITLRFQVHIVRSPAYDILMGRPFDVLTESTVQNYKNEDQTITIKDPTFGRILTIPTVRRGPPRFVCRHNEDKWENIEDEDFQEVSRN
jgi:hypothetical protein